MLKPSSFSKWIAIIALLGLNGCSKTKVITREDLRSAFRSAESFAAELELFSDYVRQGRSTKSFAQNHATDLIQEITETEKELRGVPETGTDQALQACQSGLESLREEAAQIPKLMGDDRALKLESAKLAQYRQHLSEAGHSI